VGSAGRADEMKAGHVVPLSLQAVAILRELRTIAGASHYVLPGRDLDKPTSNNTLPFALYRLSCNGRMTGHGFRAVASSAPNEAGHRPDVPICNGSNSCTERGPPAPRLLARRAGLRPGYALRQRLRESREQRDPHCHTRASV